MPNTKKKILLGLSIFFFSILILTVAFGGYAYHIFHFKGPHFDSNGVSINYFEEGRGTPVILVHGLGVNAQSNWVVPGIFHTLAQHYRVIAFDLRGHGLSDKPTDPKAYGAEMAEDIVRLMDNLHIQKAHVIGYSLGGFIVIKLLATHPDRLLSAAPCGAGWTADISKDLMLLDQVADDLDQGKGFDRLTRYLQPTGQKENALNIAFTNTAMKTINDVPAVTASIRGMKDLQVSEAQLHDNKVPTLAVIGQKDPLKKFADQMCGVMSNVTYFVAPGADHLTTLFNPATLPTLERFLAAHST
jgi:pimeloyl-ACP methyl ester carboxylesterase